jgi:hypothetical protein
MPKDKDKEGAAILRDAAAEGEAKADKDAALSPKAKVAKKARLAKEEAAAPQPGTYGSIAFERESSFRSGDIDTVGAHPDVPVSGEIRRGPEGASSPPKVNENSFSYAE